MSDCVATASAQMAPIDNDIENTIDKWKPNGFYTVDQMKQIVTFGIDVVNKARTMVDAAMRVPQLGAAQETLAQANEDLNTSLVQTETPKFISALQQANAAGINVIEAQSLRRWVIYVLKASRTAQFKVAFVACTRPDFFFTGLDALNQARTILLNVLKVAKDAVIAAGTAVLKIPDLLGSFFTVLKALPWIALVGVGYYAGVKSGLIPSRFDPARLRERDTWRPWRRAKQLSLPPAPY